MSCTSTAKVENDHFFYITGNKNIKIKDISVTFSDFNERDTDLNPKASMFK